MKRVVIESPLSGDREKHKFYARLCMRDCLERGEAPYASHLLYDHPDLLDDTKPEERRLGMDAGFMWQARADLVAVYCDLGMSAGMREGIGQAQMNRIPWEERRLPEDLMRRFRVRYPVLSPASVSTGPAQEFCPERGCGALLPSVNAPSCFQCGWVRPPAPEE